MYKFQATATPKKARKQESHIHHVNKGRKKGKNEPFLVKPPEQEQEQEQEQERRSREGRTGPEMCLVFVCDEDERVVARQAAPGACPYCGGVVQAMDVESQWRFCFLPLYFRTKRKFYCSVCARRLVTQY